MEEMFKDILWRIGVVFKRTFCQESKSPKKRPTVCYSRYENDSEPLNRQGTKTWWNCSSLQPFSPWLTPQHGFFLGAMVPFSTCKVCSTRCSTFLSCDLHICSISYSHLYVQKYPKSMLFFIYDIQTYRISSPNPRVQLASSIASWRGCHDYQWSVNRFLRANCRLMKKKAMMNCIWF